MSVLAWCALAALLVMALFLLVRDATGRPGLAAALAFGFALVPPFLFYFFQFYPEMVGALVMAVAFRTLALRPEGLRRHPWLFGVDAGDAAVAAPEVPAGLARARGHGAVGGPVIPRSSVGTATRDPQSGGSFGTGPTESLG